VALGHYSDVEFRPTLSICDLNLVLHCAGRMIQHPKQTWLHKHGEPIRSDFNIKTVSALGQVAMTYDAI
jgi:hypothetical protein